jgi:hypothetical protein
VGCEFGKYNEFERATDSSSCTSCPVGKTNFVEGAATSEACADDSTHVFNFMGCSDGRPTADGTAGSEVRIEGKRASKQSMKASKHEHSKTLTAQNIATLHNR